MEQQGPKLTVLGGGIAGLAVGHFAARRGLDVTVWEACAAVGGNCRTLRLGPFRFDTGAHRVHDQDPSVTSELRTLLGDDLRLVSAPSHVFRRGRLVAFPLRPLDLARHLGPRTMLRAAAGLAAARIGAPARPAADFEEFAVRTYGRTIAKEFLLDYSAKLWGVPCSQLSPDVAGRRLKGLGLGTLLRETLRDGTSATRHLDGSFLYPRGGFGLIAERLAASIGHARLRLGTRVARLVHDGARVRQVVGEDGEAVSCDALVSTLPLPVLVRLLDPPLPGDIRDLAARLRFRDVVLVALAVERASITRSATVYFPDPTIPFNRVYEPRNRCPEMSPPGSTMLVAELPGAAAVGRSEAELVALVRDTLVRIGWIGEPEVTAAAVHRLPLAYPLLEKGMEAIVERLIERLSPLRNLWLGGRNGRFAYAHVHDLMRSGQQIVRACAERLPEIAEEPGAPRGRAVPA